MYYHCAGKHDGKASSIGRAKRAQCCNATASVASMSLVMKLGTSPLFSQNFQNLATQIYKSQTKTAFCRF